MFELEYERHVGARVFGQMLSNQNIGKKFELKPMGVAWEECVFGQIKCCQEASDLICK